MKHLLVSDIIPQTKYCVQPSFSPGNTVDLVQFELILL